MQKAVSSYILYSGSPIFLFQRQTIDDPMSEFPIYEKTTHSVSISVRPEYLDNQSDPKSNSFTWAYHVRIENVGKQTVQILSRHWKITNSNGVTQEIVGDGLIGRQPILTPGDIFEYSSGTPLSTASGFMSGSFHAVDENGEVLTVSVPAFSLDQPQSTRALH